MRRVNDQEDFTCSSVHTSTQCFSWIPITHMTWLRCITVSKNKGGIYFIHKLPKIAATLKMTAERPLAPLSSWSGWRCGSGGTTLWVTQWLWLLTVVGSQHCSSKLCTSLWFEGFWHQSSTAQYSNEAWSVSQIAYKQFSSNSYQNQLIKVATIHIEYTSIIISQFHTFRIQPNLSTFIVFFCVWSKAVSSLGEVQ